MTVHHAISLRHTIADWDFIERVRGAFPEAVELQCRLLDVLNATNGTNFADAALPEMQQRLRDAFADFDATVEGQIENSRRNSDDGRE